MEDKKLKEKKKRYAISCTEVPEALLQKSNALNYFNQFGRIVKITFRLKSKGCIVDYDCEDAVFDAIDNGGCYEENYFTIRPFLNKKEKKLSESIDPDWPNDPDLKAELDALAEIVPHQHVFRSPMSPTVKEIKETKPKKEKILKTKTVKSKIVETKIKKPVTRKVVKKSSVKMEIKKKPVDPVELERLIGIIKQAAHTTEEKYKILDARDRLIRLHTSRQADIGDAEKVIGTCPDMCPEKERYLRESQHQVSQYEQCADDENGDYKINHKTAIKQYSRSSADQEMPLPHELRPVSVLQYTMNYLLRNIIDLCDTSDINIADWYHFVWDRTRSIRKDITQQQLCCRGSVELVEQCARFHIHCAARLISEDVSVFDPKINTENLTKCLQTLKYMYHDLALQNIYCPNEAEFRGYIILLNLHDGNFMWEVKQLRREIQKSAEVNFAIKIFLALDNNNFVSFFKLVRQTTYLNACILLRYFNEVRSRTLNRMIRTHSPRTTLTQIPLVELEHLLAFENRSALKTFIDYHGLNLNEMGTHVILDRKAFTTSNSYDLERAVNIVESKRQVSVGEIVCGEQIKPIQEFSDHIPHNSFDERGYFKKSEIEEQWLNLKKLGDTTTTSDNFFGKNSTNVFEKSIESTNIFNKPSTNIFDKPIEIKTSSIFKKPSEIKTTSNIFEKPIETKISSSSIFDKSVEMKSSSIFEKRNEIKTSGTSIFEKPIETKISTGNIFEKPLITKISSGNIFEKSVEMKTASIFDKPTEVATDSNNIFKNQIEVRSSSSVFKKPIENITSSGNIFVKPTEIKTSTNIFEKPNQSNIFNKNVKATSIFNKPTETKINLFEKSTENTNIYDHEVMKTGSIFENNDAELSNFVFKKPIEISTSNIFTSFKPENESNIIFTKPSDVSFKSMETIKPLKPFGFLENNNEFNTSKDCVDRVRSNLERSSDIYEFDSKTEVINPLKFQPYSKNKNLSKIKSNTFENKQLPGSFFAYPPSKTDIEYEEKRKNEEEKKREALKKAAEEELQRKAEVEEQKRKKQLEAMKKAEEEEIKRKIEFERAKVEMELREKLLEQVKLKREQKEREQIAESLLDELINAIEIHETQQRLKQIGNNIKLWKIQYIVKKWRNKVSNIRKKRKAVEDSPVWVAKRSYIEEANELYTSNQDLTLANMKQYKYKNQNKFKKKDEPIVKINLNQKIFEHLKNAIQKHENTIVNTFHWKIICNLPDENEGDFHTNKFLKALENTFNLKKRNNLLIVDSINPNNSDVLNICIQYVIGDFLNDKNEKFDIVIFGINDYMILQKMKKRLGTILKLQNIVIILRNGLNPQDKNKIIEILQLEQLIIKNKLKNYQIYIDDNYSLREFINSIESGLCYLASNIEQIPPLHMDLLSNFLHITIGNEFAQRLKDSAKTNIALQLSFNDYETVINLYNQAVIFLTNFVSNDANFNYPNFPNELVEYLPTKINYPCTYEYFPKYWNDRKFINSVENYFNMLYLPPINMNRWPPSNMSEFEDMLHNYCEKVVDSKNFDVIFLKVLSFTLDFIEHDTINNFQIRIENFPWIDMLQIFISYKINSILNINSNYQKVVIYNKNDLKYYNLTAWWLDSDVIHNKIEQLTDMLDKRNKESLMACEKQAFEASNTIDEDDFDIDEKLSEIKTYYDYEREIHLTKQKEDITEFKSLLEDLNNSIQIQKLAMQKFCGIIEKELNK